MLVRAVLGKEPLTGSCCVYMVCELPVWLQCCTAQVLFLLGFLLTNWAVTGPAVCWG